MPSDSFAKNHRAPEKKVVYSLRRDRLCPVFYASVTQLVECHLAKVIVEGSNPFARSIFRLAPARFYRGSVAQLVEQLTLNQRVPGSSPGTSTSLRSQRSKSEGCHAVVPVKQGQRRTFELAAARLRLGMPASETHPITTFTFLSVLRSHSLIILASPTTLKID